MKDIPGLEGRYAITIDGRVWSYPKKVGHVMSTGMFLRGNVNNNGYRYVDIDKKKRFIHRLVALTYLDEVVGKNAVNHKDGNPLNNNVENLEWCTLSENQKHSYRMGRKPRTMYAKVRSWTWAKLTEDDVRTIRAEAGKGARNADLSRRYNVTCANIAMIIKGKTWRHIL
jgi:hypothetical protein